jgi:carbon monoxide dehydrogenase subunit G
MSTISTFKSRTGKLDYTMEDVYYFVTDLRNFKRFIPPGTISDLKMEEDSCSFQVSALGIVNIHIGEKVMYNKIVFSGNALHVNDFSLIMDLRDAENRHSEVKVTLNAEMNPVLKMVASEPVRQFLETLIQEMEKFRDWKNPV